MTRHIIDIQVVLVEKGLDAYVESIVVNGRPTWELHAEVNGELLCVDMDNEVEK